MIDNEALQSLEKLHQLRRLWRTLPWACLVLVSSAPLQAAMQVNDLTDGWNGYEDPKSYLGTGQLGQPRCAAQKTMPDGTRVIIDLFLRDGTAEISMANPNWMSLNDVPNAEGRDQGEMSLSFKFSQGASWDHVVKIRKAFSGNPNPGFYAKIPIEEGVKFLNMFSGAKSLVVERGDAKIANFALSDHRALLGFFQSCISRYTYDPERDPFK